MTRKFFPVVVNTLAFFSLALAGCSGGGNTQINSTSQDNQLGDLWIGLRGTRAL